MSTNRRSYTYKGQDGVIQANLGDDPAEMFVVARVQNWEIRVTQTLEEYYEIGHKFPVALEESKAQIRGTLKKAIWDGTMLKYIIGTQDPSNIRGEIRNSIVSSIETQYPRYTPEFTIIGKIRSRVAQQDVVTVVITGVKIAEWMLAVNPNDYIMEDISFQATGISVTGEYQLSNNGNPIPTSPA